MSDVDDNLVWSIPSGSSLTCARDLVMEHSREVAFAAGHVYRVISMHPIAEPPFVKAVDEQERSHMLEADDLRQFFCLPSR